jgi:hypothetical protein
MSFNKIVRTALAALVVAGVTVSAVAAATTRPYLIASRPGVKVTSLLTVGDSVNNKPDGTPYRMVGIPDGLGAFDNGDGTFTLLMNHELVGAGTERAHGATGAFVSKWTIDKKKLTVLHGEDLIQQIALWDSAAGEYKAPAKGVVLSRFCSADLPAEGAFSDDGVGYAGRIFMNGEENGVEGRAFAHLMDGTSYELPWLGKFSWENSIANPESGPKTVVVGLDDGQNGQVYVYVGDKTQSDFPIEAAGLTNGTLYGIKVPAMIDEANAAGPSGKVPFELVPFSGVAYMTGAQLDAASEAAGVTSFQRPEDGAWDPENENDFYFVTTASFTGNSRLWRLHFNDKENPAAGGKLEMLLDGSEGQKMMDNLTITKRGQILIQEDPGNQSYFARVWLYSIKKDQLTEVLSFSPDLFTPGAAGFLTQDEESSGIIDASEILGEGWFLLDAQVHLRSADAELVEGGQLLALRIPPGLK